MTNFDLTPNEFRAASILVLECLAGMGGSRPIDLAGDEYTWCDAKTLMAHGYSAAEANGTFGALKAKGFVEDYDRNEWIVATAGWRWMETQWDRTEFASKPTVIESTEIYLKPQATETEATYLDLYR